MQTLQISVTDFLFVDDFLQQVARIVQKFTDFFMVKKEEAPKKKEDKQPVKGRAPPTLGISVNEVIKTVERPPGGR